MNKNGLLALEDGTCLWGTSVGAEGSVVGELVFNTAMTGYQEILTDPSYAGQIVSFTCPHIGNVGINIEDMESKHIWAKGIVMRELTKLPSSWRATMDLPTFLKTENVIAISGIDTRKLTHILRSKGSLNACMMGGEVEPQFAITQAKTCSGITGQNLAKKIACRSPSEWKSTDALFHVVVLDFGIKQTIVHKLIAAYCNVTIVPGDTTASSVLSLKPDGVFLSNGPGDPADCTEAIQTIRALLEFEIPIFGICLGHQLLGLASGAKTIKMEHGHHGANHPILEISTNKVFISSQNHGFAIDQHFLPPCLEITHTSLFDGSIAGISRKDKPAFSFQGHPEASPGPHELHILFHKFITLMELSHAKAY